MYDRRSLKTIFMIVSGSAILAFGFYNFYYLNDITEGGVLGLLLILKNIFNIDMSVASIIIDVMLLAMGYKFFGRKFFIYSVIASVFFSVLYGLFSYIGPVLPRFGILTSSVLGGLCVGIGSGIVIKAGCAAGGDDALALMLSKLSSIKIGTIYVIMDIVVLLLSLYYLSVGDIMYSMIAITISGKVIDFVYDFGGKNINKMRIA
ncbi:hypothetical protein EXD82_01225 [Peptacetobacter hominis]|uniref:YitT family protein n=1 Tax=Peptacetobacter hominis TaxID=2743610 RepID=A0A544QYS8_9FIRM|nr:YitT family protein [Peptacetobacter hominis]TQQ85864.1 hypothetical protein EXD82_01225 [Peptacetobacter hominis]